MFFIYVLSKYEEKNQIFITQCGITSTTKFENWTYSVVSITPIVYPKNDFDLRKFILKITAAGCKVRPVGDTYSQTGFVAEATSTNTVSVSLADYTPDDKDWESKIFVIAGINYIRIPCGRTLIDFNSCHYT